MTSSNSPEIKFKQVSINEIIISPDGPNSDEQQKDPIEVDLSEFRGSKEQLEKVHVLLNKHRDIFTEDNLDLGDTLTVTHRFVTKTEEPIAQTFRRIPPNQFEEVKRHIEDLLQVGIIQESYSPYAAPMVLARKKDGSLRMCIDYRKLNANTKKDAFPLPRILESIDAPIGATFFTTLDLASGYYQVRVEESDREKTAYISPFGLYEFIRMPFGLCGAPATFQRLMQRCLGDLTFQMVLVYLDDILIYSHSFDQHLQHLDLVFNRLRSHNLKLKPSKCHLFRSEVSYLVVTEQPSCTLRRSKRSTKGKHSNPFKEPRSVLTQQQCLTSIDFGQVLFWILMTINWYCFSLVIKEKLLQYVVLVTL